MFYWFHILGNTTMKRYFQSIAMYVQHLNRTRMFSTGFINLWGSEFCPGACKLLPQSFCIITQGWIRRTGLKACEYQRPCCRFSFTHVSWRLLLFILQSYVRKPATAKQICHDFFLFLQSKEMVYFLSQWPTFLYKLR